MPMKGESYSEVLPFLSLIPKKSFFKGIIINGFFIYTGRLDITRISIQVVQP
jgi:hypothetical protein